MKIISVHSATDSVQGNAGGNTLSGGIGRDGLLLQVETFETERVQFMVRFAGAVLTHLAAEQNLGRAAAGGIAGELLLGPLGAAAGIAMSAGNKHTFVLKSPDARVVFEASTKELQQLAGFGMPAAGDVAIECGALPKGRKKSHFWGYVGIALIIGMMVKCAVGPKEAKSAEASTSQQTATAAPIESAATTEMAPQSQPSQSARQRSPRSRPGSRP